MMTTVDWVSCQCCIINVGSLASPGGEWTALDSTSTSCYWRQKLLWECRQFGLNCSHLRPTVTHCSYTGASTMCKRWCKCSRKILGEVFCHRQGEVNIVLSERHWNYSQQIARFSLFHSSLLLHDGFVLDDRPEQLTFQHFLFLNFSHPRLKK